MCMLKKGKKRERKHFHVIDLNTIVSTIDFVALQLNETYTTEASFEVDQEGKYYVTVAAYNHALDHSIPVCSDGIVVDTTVPTVTEFEVDGSLVDPRLLRSTEGRLWLLHEDRTRQEVENASETCRFVALYATKLGFLQWTKAKLFKQGYKYHKLRKASSNFYLRHFDFV